MIASLLCLPSEPNGSALLAVRDHKGAVTITRGDSDVLSAAAIAPLALIIPGQAVRAFLTELPNGVKAKDRANMARFAHEDQLASAPTGLHMGLGPARNGGDSVATAFIDPEIMEQMVAAVDPYVIASDFEALADLGAADGDDLWFLDRVVRPGSAGMSFDPDWADGTPRQLSEADMAAAMFARLDRGDILNLRSGAYRRRANIDAGPWAKVAALFLVCAALGLGLNIAQLRAQTAQANALNAEAQALYTQATGAAPPQPLSRLARQVGPADVAPTLFLDLSQSLFTTLAEFPEVKVDRLNYQMEDASLRLRLVYPDFEAASTLEQRFAASGATFVTGGVREQDGQFIGDANLSFIAGGGS